MRKRHAAFLITLLRGVVAIFLGAALLFQPNKALPILANFMGVYWLVSGVISVRWSASGSRARGLALAAGVTGLFAGLVVLSRNLTSSVVPIEMVMSFVGLVIALTGLMHIFGGFRTGEQASRQWSWTSFLLGLFEVILGLLLVIAPQDRGVLAYLAASIWALLGGLILIGDALRVRRASKSSD